MKCGIQSNKTHVDHVKPRSIFPELQLDLMNCQVLCKKCNMEKSNIDYTDYRSTDDIMSISDFLSENPDLSKLMIKNKKRKKIKREKKRNKKKIIPKPTIDEQLIAIKNILT